MSKGKVRYLHQRDGRFYARVGVPKELREIVGASELSEALGSDRREAMRRLNAVVAGFLDQIDSARLKSAPVDKPLHPGRTRALSIHEIAATHYAEQEELDRQIRNGGFGLLTTAGFPDEFYVASLRRIITGAALDDEIIENVGWAIAKFRRRGHTTAKDNTPEWRELARELAGVELESLSRSVERDEGDFTGKPNHPLLIVEPERTAPAPSPVLLVDLFEGYLRELQASGRGAEAEKRWRPVVTDLIAFVKHGDARRLKKADLVAWKDARIGTHALKTVRDVYLASIRAILQWAMDNGQLDANPMDGVRVRLGKKIQNREKGFSDKEAKALLKIARNYQPPSSDNPQTRESATITAAKRWTPWLAAYTGARIAELTQLRKEDVREQDGITYVRIAPEAGSVKDGQYRDVPLHSHLIELGFLKFVEACGEGPLFYPVKTTGHGAAHPSKAVAGRLSKWIRSLEVVSDEVAANHAWRHRFKSVGIEAGMHARALDAIQGHAARTAGESYGTVTLKARHHAIEMHPRYETD